MFAFAFYLRVTHQSLPPYSKWHFCYNLLIHYSVPCDPLIAREKKVNMKCGIFFQRYTCLIFAFSDPHSDYEALSIHVLK